MIILSRSGIFAVPLRPPALRISKNASKKTW